MGIHTVARYGRAGSSARVRMYDWLDALELTATEHTYLGGSDNSLGTLVRNLPGALRAEWNLRQLARTKNIDTLILSRAASPFSNGGIERALLKAAKHSVYDFDDAVNTVHRSRKNPFSQAQVWETSCKTADVVIAGNQELADAASTISNNVHIVPSCVNTTEYTHKTTFELESPPLAVWIGSASTEAYLTHIAPALLALHETTGLRVKVISHPNSRLENLEHMIDRHAWNAQTFGAELAAADFGIMPLTDEPWSRGKCAYKLLQYGASRVPVIGSPVGVNAGVIAGMGGLAATTTDEWVDAVRTLTQESASQREARGQAALDHIEANFSFAAWATTWKELVLPSQ